jgi:DNA-directed RNA polymerase subunit RPC12/RpoP
VNPGETGATVIDFLCPNGHRIRCPAEQAGQAAKCPRCGVKFRVPSAEEIEMEESPQPDAESAPTELSPSASGGSPSSPSPSPSRPQKESQIEFLCPNGHHLHGPASLQGRPGACPECGSRFRIPVIDETQEEAPPEQIDLHISADAEDVGEGTAKIAPMAAAGQTPPIAHAAPAGGGSSLPGAVGTPVPGSRVSAAGRQFGTNSEIVLRDPTLASPPSARRPSAIAQGHPLAELVAKLWATKGEETKVELRLTGGDTLAPDYFVKGLSRGTHGVFGAKAGDGNWTLTVVRWDAVERVVLKDIKNLPALLSDNL